MTDRVLERITAPATKTGPLAPIPFSQGLTPKVQTIRRSESDPLPRGDILVVTWTSAEKEALADVLSPGHQYSDWINYTEQWATYESQLTGRSPAREQHCLGSYAVVTIGPKRVVLFGSNLHLATDSDSAPIVALWTQMVREVGPELVITTGTAGGIGSSEQLGDVFICNSAKFNCTKAFKDKPWAQQRFEQDEHVQPSIGANLLFAQANLIPVNSDRLTPSGLITRPTAIWSSSGDVETVDYFGFDDTDDSYGIVADDSAAKVEEMDDATLPLALSAMVNPPPWLSIRCASDPMVPSSIGDLEAQSKWAGAIYSKYGYDTTVCSALAVWGVIADLN